jgi:hypothetical protein
MKKINYEIDFSGCSDSVKNLEISTIKSLAVPSGQSLAQVWTLLLRLEPEGYLVCSAIPRDLGNWQEAGSLKLIFFKNLPAEYIDVPWNITELEKFEVESVEKLVISEGNVGLECGLIFNAKTGRQLWIVCSPAPGSVSVSLPLSGRTLFKPEFPFADYEHYPINS